MNVVGGVLLVQLVAVLATEVLRYDEAVGALEASTYLKDVRLGVDTMR